MHPAQRDSCNVTVGLRCVTMGVIACALTSLCHSQRAWLFLSSICTRVAQSVSKHVHAIVVQVAYSEIYRLGGVGGFFRGSLPLMLREIPFYILGMVLFEQFKLLFDGTYRGKEPRQLNNWQMIGIGALAGGSASFITTPFDVIKSRMMTAAAGESMTMTSAVVTLMQKEGFWAIYKGALPRALWIAPLGALNFGGYAALKRGMGVESAGESKSHAAGAASDAPGSSGTDAPASPPADAGTDGSAGAATASASGDAAGSPSPGAALAAGAEGSESQASAPVQPEEPAEPSGTVPGAEAPAVTTGDDQPAAVPAAPALRFPGAFSSVRSRRGGVHGAPLASCTAAHQRRQERAQQRGTITQEGRPSALVAASQAPGKAHERDCWGFLSTPCRRLKTMWI